MEPPPIHRLTRQDAERALERADSDADWLASLRGAYRGRHDVLDAIWWVAHPLTPTPAGRADPASELRDMQRAVFSPAAADSPLVEVEDPQNGRVLRMRAAERQLFELQQLLADDSRSLEHAWLAIQPAATEEQPPDVGTPEPAAAPRRKLVVPLLAGAGILTAILVLPTLTGMNSGMGAESTASPAATTPTTTPHARTEIVTLQANGNVSDPLEVLARPQAESEEPRHPFGGRYQPGSFRRLPDLVGFLELYLARGEHADICLVVLRDDGTSMSGCVPEAGFAEHGIELGGSGGQYKIGDMTVLSESFTLQTNGDVHYEATARAPSMAPSPGTIAPGHHEHVLGGT